MNDIETLKAKYTELYGVAPAFVVRAPGRVNLIGEHTDYNDGYVFPAAIDYEVTLVGTPRPDHTVRAYSLTFEQSTTFSLDTLTRSEDAPWSNYLRAVASVLAEAGHALQGMNVLVSGTVPLGSGLSSSAAIEVASILAFEAAGGFTIEPVNRALLAQRAEHSPFVGVKTGIMDQFISALGKADYALFIDTRTLAYEAVPLPAEGVALVIANTNKPRGLVDSEYNTRRAECEQAVALLKEKLPEITALRDVSEEAFAAYADLLPEPVRRRARHVVTEDARVLKSVTALKAGDVAQFGRLMDASHNSLRDDYAVSCRELDVMVEAARKVHGVYGSRMTGAGFGGCTVSLVRADALDSFQTQVGQEYESETGRRATFYVCHASEGASRLE